MDNITMENVPSVDACPIASSVPSVPIDTTPLETSTTTQPSIMTVDIKDENVALNIMVSFLNIAQKRGAFNLEESARIWQCVQKFIIQAPNASPVEPVQS